MYGRTFRVECNNNCNFSLPDENWGLKEESGHLLKSLSIEDCYEGDAMELQLVRVCTLQPLFWRLYLPNTAYVKV
jgi:hypothetical protein